MGNASERALHRCIYSKRANVSRHAAGTAPLTLRRGKKGKRMAKKEQTEMWPDLKGKWEQIQECYNMLKNNEGHIVCKMINGKSVNYTEKCRKKEKRKSITIGEYKIQQPIEKHVSIVWEPENQLVFFMATDHWYTEEELKAVFAEHMKMAGGI